MLKELISLIEQHNQIKYTISFSGSAPAYNHPRQLDISNDAVSTVEFHNSQCGGLTDAINKILINSDELKQYQLDIQIEKVSFDVGHLISAHVSNSDDDHDYDSTLTYEDVIGNGNIEMPYNVTFNVTTNKEFDHNITEQISEAVGICIWGQYYEDGSGLEIKEFNKL